MLGVHSNWRIGSRQEEEQGIAPATGICGHSGPITGHPEVIHLVPKNALFVLFGCKTFIPIYPNVLPTVPKRSRASRTASLVFSNLPASQSATTRLENR